MATGKKMCNVNGEKGTKLKPLSMGNLSGIFKRVVNHGGLATKY